MFYCIGKKGPAAVGTILLAILVILRIADHILPEMAGAQKKRLLTDLVVVLDPGHGGIDPGVHYGDLLEKNINLTISLILRESLKKKEATVYLTREDDRADPDFRRDLENRVEFIREKRPHLLISIHVNSFAHPACFGGQAFFRPGDDISKRLAQSVQRELCVIQPGNHREAQPGNFYILQKTDATAILIETGFIFNARDRERLQDPGEQEKIAEALTRGLLEYFWSL